MYHTIEFRAKFWVDLEISPRQPLERMLIHVGTRLQAQLKPYVVETEDGPVEVADLFCVDGTTARSAFRVVFVRGLNDKPQVHSTYHFPHLVVGKQFF